VLAALGRVPAAKLAGLTPLPGGTGGAEALLAGLLVRSGGRGQDSRP